MIKENSLKGYVINIEEATLNNSLYRKVLYTAKHSQLVLMSIRPNEDVGEEVHKLDQFIRVEAGKGVAIINGTSYDIADKTAIIIPAGAKHNIINISPDADLKLYTIYSPPEHKDGTAQKTKSDAAIEEHFDGTTSE